MNKKLFIAGNWKSNKTLVESKAWMDQFHSDLGDATVVLCVPFTVLSYFHDVLAASQSHLQLGAQNVSPFSNGAYTGEINASQIKELASWVIIGHSERRKNFGEADLVLQQRVDRALETGLQIIYCVQDDHSSVPKGVHVVAYEPVWAIGTGKADSPENANAVLTQIKKATGISTGIYGGSITHENVKSFVTMDAIDGVLPGGASLDPGKFQALISAAL
ncbi:MAG: triose-phosphate isomerase family protein [Patescibacteria group bacterium]